MDPSVVKVDRPRLWVAVALSVLIHAAGGLTASRLGVPGSGSARNTGWSPAPAGSAMLVDWDDVPDVPVPAEVAASEPRPPELQPAPMPPPPVEDSLKLGISDSEQDTDNVMGFNDPTEHMARESEVDQPALDPMPGGGGDGGSPVAAAQPAMASQPETAPPVASVTSSQDAAAPVGPPEPTEEERRAAALGDGDESREASKEIAEGETGPMAPGIGAPEGESEPKPAVEAAMAGRDVVNPDRGQADNTVPEREQGATEPVEQSAAGGATTQPPASPVPPAEQSIADGREGDGAAPGPVGQESEKEADAASRKKPIQVILGRPAAGEGLEIITKRPRRNPFSLVTRVTAMPSNPIIEVQFDRTGRVYSAKITKSSGHADVDGPVLAAVYAWSAKGKAVNELRGADVITVVVTILLR